MIAAAFLLAAAGVDPVAGTWEGTSLCQVKPSACRDEHVIYRIRKTAAQRYMVDAFKLVEGKELFMGPLDLILDTSGHSLSGSHRDSAGVIHPWLFSVNGAHISGKALTAPGGQVFRLIELTKR